MRRAVLLLLWSGAASAGGLEIPDHGSRAVARGGAFGAKASDPTAVVHNPGALSRLRGVNLAWNHNLLWSHTRFTRSESAVSQEDKQGQDPFEPVENETPLFALGGLIAATHDFGMDGFTFGASVYGPSGSGHAEYPATGGQRYMVTEFDALILYYGLSVAWGTDELGFGATLQWADMAQLRYQLVVDGGLGDTPAPYVNGGDVVGTIEVSDRFAPAAVVGGWWRPVTAVEVALSGRPFPIKFEAEGDIELANVPGGRSAFSEQQLHIDDQHATLELVLPPTARVAARYRHMDGDEELFDLELDFVYEAWSMVESYHIDLEGEISLFGGHPAQDAVIERRWRDTLSFRLGGTYNANDWLGVSLGGYYERGATPENYTHLDLLSLDRYGIGGGVEFDFGGLDVVVAYMHTFQPDVTVDERFGKVYQQRPVAPCPDGCSGLSGIPANAGKFESGFDMVSVAIGGRL